MDNPITIDKYGICVLHHEEFRVDAVQGNTVTIESKGRPPAKKGPAPDTTIRMTDASMIERGMLLRTSQRQSQDPREAWIMTELIVFFFLLGCWGLILWEFVNL